MTKLEVKEENGKIFCPLKGEFHISTPEEKVRQNYICILVNDYGYSLDQMDQEVIVSNSRRGQGNARADIVIWKSKQEKQQRKKAFIVVECKAENVRIHLDDYYQGSNYAAWAGAEFFITTNQKETKYFNVDANLLPKDLEEIVSIPNAIDIEDEKKIALLKNQTKTFTREEFTKVLKACHNIIRNNDKLSPEAAFDEISKLLFMKIRFERDNKGMKVFTKAEYENLAMEHEKYTKPGLINTDLYKLSYMQFLFRNTKEYFKDDKLFDDKDEINIRENSFKQILEKLETYNLSDTQDDVKGIAFEQFLGTTFRGELGQFFTPRTIVDFMTEILDPVEGEIICDPTCGSGGFLIRAFEYIREKIEKDIKDAKMELREELEGADFNNLSEKKQLDINEKIEKMQNALNSELDTSLYNSRMSKLSKNCIYGTDANPRMARTSKMNMIMHGDGHGGVHHHDGLLNVNGIFEERFDVILTNPPFGQNIDKNQEITDADRFNDEELKKKYIKAYGSAYEEALKQVEKHIGDKLLSLYDLGSVSTLTEVLFMERCLKLLKKGGRMGMVLPEGVLNNKNLQSVREYFEGRAKLLLICSIPQDVFIAAGATVKPSLVFMKKFTEEEELEYKNAYEAAIAETIDKYDKEYKEINNIVEKCKKDNEELNDILNNKISKSDVSKIKKQIKENIKLLNENEKKFKKLQETIELEAKPLVKSKFNYDIPIAKVTDAGITTTGAKSEGNELPKLLEEYTEYRKKNKLWISEELKYSYKISKNSFIRMIGDVEDLELDV